METPWNWAGPIHPSSLAPMDYWLNTYICCHGDNVNDVHLNSAFHTDTHFNDISDGRWQIFKFEFQYQPLWSSRLDLRPSFLVRLHILVPSYQPTRRCLRPLKSAKKKKEVRDRLLVIFGSRIAWVSIVIVWTIRTSWCAILRVSQEELCFQ